MISGGVVAKFGDSFLLSTFCSNFKEEFEYMELQ